MFIVTSFDDGMENAKKISYPISVKPAYGLNGEGTSIANNEDELAPLLRNAFRYSLTEEVEMGHCESPEEKVT